MVVCRTIYTFMVDGPQRVGTKFDLIGWLSLTHCVGHSWGSASIIVVNLEPLLQYSQTKFHVEILKMIKLIISNI